MQRAQRDQRILAFVWQRWKSFSDRLDEQSRRQMAGGSGLPSHVG